MRKYLTYILFSIFIFTIGCSFNKNVDNVIYLPERKFEFNIIHTNEDGTIRKTDRLELEVTNSLYPARTIY